MISDSHLEQALAHYNQRVSDLELKGPREDLLEAYINRGTVLMMMESYVAAMSDFDEAIDLIQEMEADGDPPDLGLFVRAYENRGQMYCGDDDMLMVSDYARIAEKLPVLRHGTRYFQTKDIVQMCINCAEDLLDEGFWENALPFLEKGRSLVEDKYDPWSQNRLAQISGLFGEAYEGMGLHNSAEHHLTDAIIIESTLRDRRTLDDRFQLILDLVARGDIREFLKNEEGSLADHSAAADMLEEMLKSGESDDAELFVNLCQRVGSGYIKKGMIPEGERYLVKGMKHRVPGVREAMRDMGLE